MNHAPTVPVTGRAARARANIATGRLRRPCAPCIRPLLRHLQGAFGQGHHRALGAFRFLNGFPVG